MEEYDGTEYGGWFCNAASAHAWRRGAASKLDGYTWRSLYGLSENRDGRANTLGIERCMQAVYSSLTAGLITRTARSLRPDSQDNENSWGAYENEVFNR